MRDNEIWVQIPNERKYAVSNWGRLKNLETHNIIRAYCLLENYGYYVVDLDKGVYYVHDLVAESFCEGRGKVIHLNGLTKDNYYENLSYVKKTLADDKAERWRPIVNLEDSGYLISTYGRIKNSKGFVLKPYNDGGRYPKIDLSYAGGNKNALVHGLVAAAFLVQLDSDAIHVDHINGIKKDNHIDNLRFLTPEENLANIDRYEPTKWCRNKIFKLINGGCTSYGTAKQLYLDDAFVNKVLKNY